MYQRVLAVLMLMFAMQIQAAWLVGAGKSDITGPSVGLTLLGYGEAVQRGTGIHDRMWARAFIVAEQDADARVVMVSISAGMVFGDVTREVVERLQQRYGRIYQEGNLLLLADHTHSGNGGQGGHLLFSLASHGYSPSAYEAMVAGIVDAIAQAHEQLAPGRVFVNQGELRNASANRSLKAFLRNPEAGWLPSIDPEMLVLRFEQQGKPVGMLGWFATHGVSFPMSSTLISGDNKAYAAQLMEAEMGDGFVAAFPQTNSGDMTPNLFLNGTGPGETPEESARMIGERQYQKGRELFWNAVEEVRGDLNWQHKYVDFSSVRVPERLTGISQEITTCKAAVGYGFAAGSPDGRPRPWRFFFKEGYTKNGYWPFTWVSDWLTGLTPEIDNCQYPKPALMALGADHHFQYLGRLLDTAMGGAIPDGIANRSWIPQVLPVSLVQLGTVGLLGVPAEFTIVSGHRLKKTVSQVTGDRLSHLVVAGYANDYSLYVTTPEEYQEQFYEGGATLFGQWTLPAYQQVFEDLAHDLVQPGVVSLSSVEPDDLRRYYQTVVEPEVPCPGAFSHHGILETNVPDVLWSGQNVTACFTASHPNIGVRRVPTFLSIEKQDETGQWLRVASDDSWDTRFHWRSRWFGETAGQACIEWYIPVTAEEGVYRIGHHGLWRDSEGAVKAYSGYSPAMVLIRQVPAAVMLMQSRDILAKRALQRKKMPQTTAADVR